MLPPARNRCNTSLTRRDSTVFTCYHLLEIGVTQVLLVGTVLCSCISGRGRLTHAATVNSKESNYSYTDVFQICSFALPVEFFEIVKNYQTSDSLQENVLKESNYTNMSLPSARRSLGKTVRLHLSL